MAATKYFEVKLKRSASGRQETQKRTLKSLGLTRFGKTVCVKDTPQNRGALYKVVHLVDLTPKEGELPPSARERQRAAASAS